MTKNNNFLVSVCMITYNHENFIQQAIEGVLNQNTNFKIELIISDDCSTDKTTEIIQNIIDTHVNGKWIKLYKNQKNIGMRENFSNALKMCQGKYIALCEGDDFWTKSEKLKIQINFLENHSDYSACFHQALILNNDLQHSTLKVFSLNMDKRTYSFNEIIESWFIATCSLVFRNILLNNPNHPIFSSILFFSDRPLEAFLAKTGKFYYFPNAMACYRNHDNGITKIGNKIQMSFEGAKANKMMIRYFPESKKILSEQVIRWNLLAAKYSFQSKKIHLYIFHVLKCLLEIRTFLGFKNTIKCSVRILLKKSIY